MNWSQLIILSAKLIIADSVFSSVIQNPSFLLLQIFGLTVLIELQQTPPLNFASIAFRRLFHPATQYYLLSQEIDREEYRNIFLKNQIMRCYHYKNRSSHN
jgi:hypothetical protein